MDIRNHLIDLSVKSKARVLSALWKDSDGNVEVYVGIY